MDEAIYKWLLSKDSNNSNNIRYKIERGSYRLHLNVTFNNNSKYDITIRDVDIDAQPHYLDLVINDFINDKNNTSCNSAINKNNFTITNRIIVVHFNDSKLKNYSNVKHDLFLILNDIGKEGLTWMNEKFEFIISKEPSTGIAYFYKLPCCQYTTNNNNNNNNNNHNHKVSFGTLQLPTVFLPISNSRIEQSKATEERLPSSAHELRSIVADFQSLPTVSSAASRIGLLLSSTYHGCRWKTNTLKADCDNNNDNEDNSNDDTISIIFEDDNKDNNGHDTTDGSGFISYDLAQCLPSVVFQGKPTSSVKRDVIASCFQCRIVCNQGLFKGTLVTNPNLKKTIVLRKSMMKVSASTKLESCKNYVDVEIVNTTTNPKSYANLNKHLILILSYCGVSYETFYNLIDDKLKILRHLSDYCTVQMSDTDIQDLTNSLELMPLSKEKITIQKMLSAGQRYLDPFIQISLRKIIEREVNELVNFSLPIKSCFFIVGIPGEVFFFTIVISILNTHYRNRSYRNS